MNTTRPENQLVADVALGLVEQIAPQEKPLFKANSEAYFKDPNKALSPKAGKDQMLGFGVAVATSFLTPMALAVTGEVISYLIPQVKKSLEQEGTGVIDAVVKSLFKHFRPPEQKPAIILTTEQLKEVHEAALAKARMLKMSDERANLLADAIVSELAI